MIFSLIAGFLLTIAVAIAIDYKIAKMFADVASRKGYSNETKVLLLSFFLGVVGWVYVAALPDEVLRKQNDEILQNLHNKP